MAKLRMRGFPLGDWQTNAWLVWVDYGQRNPGWIVDPGAGPQAVIEFVLRHGIEVEAILFTHAHMDHIMGLEEVATAFPSAPIYAHPVEHAWFGDPQLNLSAFAGIDPVSVRSPTRSLEAGSELALGPTRWTVLHTPGHSPGSVTLYCKDAGVAIVGDTLFAGSVGRSDFPSSDTAALMDSLTRTLMSLPDATAVHPGHGPSTTIGAERRSNPFLTGRA